MNATQTDQLLDKLIDLMALEDNREWTGTPFVDADGTFGVTCGKKNGGLYAAYFLMDGLGRSGLLEPGGPRTNLDTAIYELGPGKVFEPWKGARLFRDLENELRVEIKTEKPLTAVMQAIDTAAEEARAEHRNKVRREIEYRKEREEDRQRDHTLETFTGGFDDTFVKSYLDMRVEKEFPGSDPYVSYGRRDAELEKLLDDTRPVVTVEYDHPAGENYLRDNQFREGLTSVFNGFCAITPNQSRDTRMEFTVTGSPARLALDIVDHDPEGARETLEKISPIMNADAFAAGKSLIDKREAMLKAQREAQKGIQRDIPVKAPLQLRR